LGGLSQPIDVLKMNMLRAGSFFKSTYKMLTVLDEYTRQALCVEVKPKMGSADVLEALYKLLLKHGKPDYIRSDNGSEFIARALQLWLRKVGIKPIQIYPGSPWRTATMSASMELYVMKFSMPNGSQASTKPKSSSICGSKSTTISGRISP